MTPDYIGLRDEDLGADGRAAVQGHMSTHREALALGDELRALPTAKAPPIEAVYAQAIGRPWWQVPSGLLLAASVLLAVLATWPTEDPMRARGMTVPGAIAIEAVAESAGVRRALKAGDTVHNDERVAFRLRVAGPGSISLTEGETPVWPASGDWKVDAGSHWVGAETVQTWRPEGAPGERVYTARWCPADGDCLATSMPLVWAR